MRTLRLVALVLLGLSALPRSFLFAQKTALGVGDLVETRQARTFWRLPMRVGPGLDEWYWGDDREYELIGASELIRHQLPPLTLDLLTTVVEQVVDSPSIVPARGYVLVDDEEADRARVCLDMVREAVLAETIQLELRLEERRGDAWAVLTEGSTRCRAGHARKISDTTLRRMLLDFNVEIASSAAIGDPDIHEYQAGAAVVVRARVLPGTEFAVLEFVSCQREFGEPEEIKTESTQLGNLERLVLGQSQAGISSLLERGIPSRHMWTAANGREHRLTIRGEWAPPKEDENEALLLSSLLNARVLDFWWAREGPEFEEQFAPERLGSVEQEMLDSIVGDGCALSAHAPGQCGLRALYFGPNAPLQRKRVRALLKAFEDAVAVEVDVLSCSAGHVPKIGEEESANLKRLARVHTRLLTGRTSSFTGEVLRSFIEDWNVEIAGGGGRIGDPTIDTVRSGYRCSMRASRRSPKAPIELDLDLQLQDCTWMPPLLVTMAAPMLTPGWVSPATSVAPTTEGGSGSDYAFPERVAWSLLIPGERGRVERPEIARKDLQLELTLQPGETRVIRRAAPTLLPPGRELVLLVRAQ